MWDIILDIFLFIAGLAIGRVYALIAVAAWRAFTARNLDRVRVGADVVALLWPVSTPVLKVYDLVTTSGENVFMSDETYGHVVRNTAYASERDREAAIAQAHAEWQARVNYFYALGAKAEEAGDWLAGERVAENLDFLLETEPPKPKVEAVSVTSAKPPAIKVERKVKKADMEELWTRIERKAEIYRRETVRPETYFCNVCTGELKAAKFELWKVAGICDPCFTEIHKGDQ
jgi:hypothetical protein